MRNGLPIRNGEFNSQSNVSPWVQTISRFATIAKALFAVFRQDAEPQKS
jgi:hypothetical protein